MKKAGVSKIASNNQFSIMRWLETPMTIAVAFALGIFVSGTLGNLLFIGELAALAILAILICLLLKKRMPIALIMVFILALGFYQFMGFLANQNISSGCSEVKISSNPKTRTASREFLVQDGLGRKAVVNTTDFGSFAYGDKVKLCFEAKNVVSTDRKTSRYFLSQYKNAYQIKNPQIELIGEGRGLLRALYALADTVSKKILYLYSGDTGILAKGLLLGGSQGFSSEFSNAIKNSGTSHLVAVSGYNVSIITIILFRYIRAAFSRRSAIIFSIIFLVCFCLLSGATASVVRASLMGLMYIIAKIIGRRGAIINSLFVAAFFMLILNPFALWDIGFELSFMATFGLIFLGEPMIKLFFGRLKDGTAKDVASTLCETISAQLFTLPILLSAFGKISIIAPIANVLILLLVPLAMLLIFISVIGAFLWQNIGLLLAGVANVLLDYFVAVIKFFGSLKMAALSVNVAGAGWVLAMYISIFILSYFVRLGVRIKLKNG